MPEPAAYDNVRYLHAKRTVDDRALNRGVLAHLRAELADLPQAPRVLELGAGAGTMVTRLADIGWIRRARYTLVDSDPAHLAAASDHLRAWAGPALASDDSGADPAVVVRDGARDLEVDLVAADVFAWADAGGAPGGAGDAAAPYDLVIANAFLDMVDVPALLPALWRRVLPGRPFWFSINFDGETIFLPEHPLDGAVLALYHDGMDRRISDDGRRAGESKAGRHLLQHLPASGARILDAGSSDWVVWPSPPSSSPSAPGARGYAADEAYFLHHIVHTIDVALRAAPAPLDASAFARWVAARHAEIDRGELIYIAHQLDVVGRAPAAPAAQGASVK